MSTEEKTDDNKVEGKKAEDAPPVNLGWDSHSAVVSQNIVFSVLISSNNTNIKWKE